MHPLHSTALVLSPSLPPDAVAPALPLSLLLRSSARKRLPYTGMLSTTWGAEDSSNCVTVQLGDEPSPRGMTHHPCLAIEVYSADAATSGGDSTGGIWAEELVLGRVCRLAWGTVSAFRWRTSLTTKLHDANAASPLSLCPRTRDFALPVRMRSRLVHIVADDERAFLRPPRLQLCWRRFRAANLLSRNRAALHRLGMLQVACLRASANPTLAVDLKEGDEEWDVTHGILDSLTLLASLRSSAHPTRGSSPRRAGLGVGLLESLDAAVLEQLINIDAHAVAVTLAHFGFAARRARMTGSGMPQHSSYDSIYR
ncbi:hypothetical protein K438DRAFT_1958261 [Mycena galopus ATCC 62051]|nr:hypothetical protein K438DRAFT_1958261 [Mycena galopus ATCC 62051]